MLFGREEMIQSAQNLRELLSGQLGCSAGARAEAREFDDFVAGQGRFSRSGMPTFALIPTGASIAQLSGFAHTVPLVQVFSESLHPFI
jgi:hypothetical protein